MRQINYWPAPKRDERKEAKVGPRAICVLFPALFGPGGGKTSVFVSSDAKEAAPSGHEGHASLRKSLIFMLFSLISHPFS
jgi:hypothetical protein